MPELWRPKKWPTKRWRHGSAFVSQRRPSFAAVVFCARQACRIQFSSCASCFAHFIRLPELTNWLASCAPARPFDCERFFSQNIIHVFSRRGSRGRNLLRLQHSSATVVQLHFVRPLACSVKCFLPPLSSSRRPRSFLDRAPGGGGTNYEEAARQARESSAKLVRARPFVCSFERPQVQVLAVLCRPSTASN